MIDPEDIVSRYRARKAATEGVNARRNRVRAAYNGEVQVILPDLDRSVQSEVANLLHQGLEQMAGRVASNPPTVYCPPRSESVKREVTQAKIRQQAILGWWEHSNIDTNLYVRAKYLLAYAQTPVLIWPGRDDDGQDVPTWQIKSPMDTFASNCTDPHNFTPSDAIFRSTQSYGWLKTHYPDAFGRLARREKPSVDACFQTLQFTDHDELVTVVLGDLPDGAQDGTYDLSAYTTPGWTGGSKIEVLDRRANKAGVCLAVTPGRLSLSKAMGQFDGILGMMATAAELMALEVVAVRKGVFPDQVIESRQGETAALISNDGQWVDGRTGLVNILKGGQMRTLDTNPGYQTNPTLDRLERNARLTAGIPAELGGEAASNIRTGRRGESLLAAAVDFPIQEQQKILARGLREENKRAIAVAKGWGGSRGRSFYVSWKGSQGIIDFVPNEVFTTNHNVVKYSYAGSDANGLVIMVGQLVGTGLLSKQTGAELISLIDDPEQEHDRGVKEALEAALLSGWQQKLAAGEIAPIDAAWVMDQVANNKLELAQAIMKVDERVKQRQASAAEVGQPGGPVMPGSPEAMPGLAAGTPAEAQAVQPTIGPPGESTQNLAQMLSALRRPQQTIPSERPAAVA